MAANGRSTLRPATAGTSARRAVAVHMLLGSLALTQPGVWAQDAPTVSVFVGDWEGRLVVNGEPLEVRMAVREGADGVAVEVDYPQLVFADQPASATVRDGALVVDLPLGMGEAAFRPEGGGLAAEPDPEAGVRIDLSPAERFEPTREPIRFGAFEPELKGTLVLPPGDGPFPLVILTAGSGNPTRTNWSYASWSDPLARRGVASLVYDRRPDDARRRDGSAYDIEDQARDLSAALDRLESDERLDFDRLGVLAHSRGAWIALALGASDPRVDFLAARGGAAVGVVGQDLQKVEARMRAAGEPEAAIREALAFTRLYFHVVAHPEDWPRLAAAIEAAQGTQWGEYVRSPESVANLEWFRAHLAFDPLPMISRLRVPVFFAWGSEDRITPPGDNRPLFRALLDPGLAGQSRFPVYEGASHTVEGPLNTDDDEAIAWAGMSQRFLADLWDWLAQRGVIR